MAWLGDYALGATINTSFTTVQSTGAPITLAGGPVLSAYPGSSTTEITAGITLTVDFDARTGYHHVTIVASTANGYVVATDYRVVITTGTVNGVSAVGYVVAEFSIQNRPNGIRKNTALNNFEFPIYASTDHVTPLTGATVAVQVSIDGAAYVNATNTPALEIGASGRYKITLAAADLNGNVCEFKATATGADPMDWTIVPVT